MVSFKQIQDAFMNNPSRAMEVAPRFQVAEEGRVDIYKLPTAPAAMPNNPPAPKAPQVVPNNPPAAASPPPLAPKAPQVVANNPPLAPLAPKVPQVVTVIPNKPAQQQPPLRNSNRKPVDPLLLDMETRDAMYEIANPVVKQEIEIKEAHRLEARLNELYASENGRARGWTKTHLAEFLKPRTISGGKASQFDWSAVFSDKKLSAALDFVALAKGIRVAVWNPAEKVVGIWPAADSSNMVTDTEPPVYHVSVTGQPMPEKTSVFETGWMLRAPMSVEHSLEKLSLDELSNIAQSLGVTGAEGKKAERVRLLATARMVKRFHRD